MGHMLTRDAMKKLKGGEGEGEGHLCYARTAAGYRQEMPGVCEGTRVQCNALCQQWCARTEGCISCNCA